MTHHNHTCDEFQEQLSGYLEGTLTDSAVADAELHLAACAVCRQLVTDLQEIARQAAALPALVPSHDLWPAIEARTQPRVLPFSPKSVPPAAWNRVRLGAIAAGLVAITALTTYQLTRRPGEPPSNAVTAVHQPSPPAPESVVTGEIAQPIAPAVTPVAAAEARRARPAANVTFVQEIERLRDVLDERSEELDPRTIAILKSSIATIDSAIADARRALAREPASGFLSQQLNKSLEQKLGLLRRAALMSPST
ncbi:MAG: zf-HC2 domain-containing protein [Gemmatimonadaceae bacterium]